MGKHIGGFLLIGVAVLMLVGFFGSGATLAEPATWLALLIGVALPAGAGIALLGARGRAAGRRAERADELRRRTIESEVLRLAGQHGGRLTVVEVVRDLALDPVEAKDTLDTLMRRDLADIEVTDSGVLVYRFRDVQLLGEKDQSRGLLDA